VEEINFSPKRSHSENATFLFKVLFLECGLSKLGNSLGTTLFTAFCRKINVFYENSEVL
jgi:hypothetical protein